MTPVRFLFVLPFVLGTFIFSPARAQSPPDAVKYWVFFTDKGAEAGAKADAVSVRPEALARRARRGGAIPSEIDRGPSPAYVRTLRALGVTPLVESRWLNAVSARLSSEKLAAVRALPFVRGVRPVGGIKPLDAGVPRPLVEARPVASASGGFRLEYGNSETQLSLVNDIAVLERGIDGTGVRLGLLDTGIGDLTRHPAFARMLDEGRLIESRDFTNQPDDGSRHGRSVLSVAAGFDEGNLIGPAHGAEILHARTEYTPTETNQEEDNFVAGLEWLESMGVDVVNVSLGYSEFDAGQHSYTVDDMNGDTAVTTIAADMAAALGVTMVSSAGNEGCASPDLCWYFITSPADADSVITVGAVSATGAKAGFSSFGPTADGRIKPDVAAMGVSVWLVSSDVGYGFSNGTSFSSPMVAGVVAQILQVNPDLTPVEVRALLRETASQAQNPDNALGWGLIDADAAVTLAEAMATGTEAGADAAPPSVTLFPNPVTGAATFEVRAPLRPAHARLSVFDVLGRRVAVPFDGILAPGLNRLRFDASPLPPGVYFYTLESERARQSGNLVVMR
jgi:subtilisin family serine protease